MHRDPTPAYDGLLATHVLPGRSLLAVLHGIQRELGYIPGDAIAPLAKAMHLSRAEVHGVITYYHHFRDRPPAAVRVTLCRAESCRSMGSEALVAHAEGVTGCEIDGERVGDVSLHSVYCLGLCAQSPALMIGDTAHARVSTVRFDTLLERAVMNATATRGERSGGLIGSAHSLNAAASGSPAAARSQGNAGAGEVAGPDGGAT